jgi:hypothetical protein
LIFDVAEASRGATRYAKINREAKAPAKAICKKNC